MILYLLGSVNAQQALAVGDDGYVAALVLIGQKIPVQRYPHGVWLA